MFGDTSLQPRHYRRAGRSAIYMVVPGAWPWGVSVAAWGLVGLTLLTQHAYLLDHHQLMDGHTMYMAGHYMRMGGLHLPWFVALPLFLASWQVMTAAMMLPSSLPLVTQVSRAQARPHAAVAGFLAGYATTWTAFALVAFVGDLLLMRVGDAWPWLADHPWVVGVATLAVAGGYELSAVKARYLRACRGPVQRPGRRERLDAGFAWRGGLRHGGWCVCSCGPLMWVMCATGLPTVPVMVLLTAVMLAEKATRCGMQLTRGVGLTLLLLAALGLVHPGALGLGA